LSSATNCGNCSVNQSISGSPSNPPSQNIDCCYHTFRLPDQKKDPCKSAGGQWCVNPSLLVSGSPAVGSGTNECVFINPGSNPVAASGSSCMTPAGSGNVMGACMFTSPSSTSLSATLCYKNFVY
jgi:hypothetical protein